MDEDVRERVEAAAEESALYNALKHDSDAQVGAIMGPLMGENPEFETTLLPLGEGVAVSQRER